MEGSPENGERRARRTGILIGVLVAVVIGLGVALALVLTNDDDKDGGEVTTPTAATTATAPTQTTVTETEPQTTTTAPPSTPTIDQGQAKQAAARGASAEVRRFGITVAPSDWDTRCTAQGGTDQSATWTCQVAANGGQCSGTIVAFARAAGVAGTRNPQVGCGE